MGTLVGLQRPSTTYTTKHKAYVPKALPEEGLTIDVHSNYIIS